MKTYEEMAQSALMRGNAIRKQRSKSNKILFGAISGFVICCVVVIMVLGLRDFGSDTHQEPPISITHQEPPISISISVDSLAELDKMREMISCTDEEVLNNYLRSLSGGGARSRDDLILFLNVLDSLPILEIIDGEIIWISYFFDDEDKEDDVVIISTKSANGDWVRVEYLINESNVGAEIKRREAAGEYRHSTIDTPIQSKAGRIQVYSEVREDHPSGIGYLINWNVVVDGILTRVVYYSEDIDDMHAESLFDDLKIGSLNHNSHFYPNEE